MEQNVGNVYTPPKNGFRTFIILWATQSISAMGSAITYFSLTLWITLVLYPQASQKSELAFTLSAVALFSTITTMVVAPFAGAWADRHDRKLIMIITNFSSVGLSVILLGLLLTHSLNMWTLILVSVLDSILGAFHNSAFDASYVMLVPDKQLPRANGMMQTMWSLAGILPPAIAATLISIPSLSRQGLIPQPFRAIFERLSDGTPIAVSIDAVTFLIAAVTLLFLFVPSPDQGRGKGRDTLSKTGERTSIWQDIREGAQFIWHRSPLLWLLASFTVGNLAGAVVGVLPPLLLRFNLHGALALHGLSLQSGLAVFSTVSSVGGLAGGLLMSIWGGLRQRRVYGVVIALALGGIAQTILGLSPFWYVTIVMAFVMNAMIPVMNSHSQSIWQTQTPRELQGRVFSVRRVIAQFTFPIGTLVAGWTGGAFSPGIVIAIFGSILALFSIAQLFNPYLLRAEDSELLNRLAANRTTHNDTVV